MLEFHQVYVSRNNKNTIAECWEKTAQNTSDTMLKCCFVLVNNQNMIFLINLFRNVVYLQFWSISVDTQHFHSPNECWNQPTYVARFARCVHRNTTLKGKGGREKRWMTKKIANMCKCPNYFLSKIAGKINSPTMPTCG